MHNPGYLLRRISLPRIWVNRDAGGYRLGFDPAKPDALANGSAGSSPWAWWSASPYPASASILE